MPKSIFCPGGFESKSVTDTRATTDKNDPFFEYGVHTREKVGGQKWGKMHYGVRAYNKKYLPLPVFL